MDILSYLWGVSQSLCKIKKLESFLKNAKVIPKALHTAFKVGSVGTLLLLNIFVTVE